MSVGGSSQSGSSQSSSAVDPRAWQYMTPALERGLATMNQGYVPYQGLDVAAFNPSQVAGMQGANDWSAAFNTPGQAAPSVAASLPQAQTQDGLTGYSSFQGYQDQLSKLKETYPGLYKYIQSFAIDPVTGAPGSRMASASGDGSGVGMMSPQDWLAQVASYPHSTASQEGMMNFWDPRMRNKWPGGGGLGIGDFNRLVTSGIGSSSGPVGV